jgi:hypothetical protein
MQQSPCRLSGGSYNLMPMVLKGTIFWCIIEACTINCRFFSSFFLGKTNQFFEVF